jgi:hypothetical protein
MVTKPHPNQAIYLESLRRMTPEQRLLKALELTEMSRELPRAGILQQSPTRAFRSGSACIWSSSSAVGTGLPEAPVAAR